jgi:hypothetical protein
VSDPSVAGRDHPQNRATLTNGPFGVSTNAAGVIDGWGINMVDMLADSEMAEILSGPDRDYANLGAPNPPNGLKLFFGADTPSGPGVWTVSTSTGVLEPASGTLLIAGLVGLAGLALKKSL